MQAATPYEWFERAGGREALAERLTWRGLGRRCIAGTLGGLVAGAAMMAFAILFEWRAGLGGAWLMPKLFAATFMGVGALLGGAGAVVIGLAIHAFTSAAWGIFFAFCVSRRVTLVRSLGLGLAHAFLVWSTMTWTVLPWADPTLYERYRLIANPWLAIHVVYGVCSFVIVFLLKLFPRRHGE